MAVPVHMQEALGERDDVEALVWTLLHLYCGRCLSVRACARAFTHDMTSIHVQQFALG
jgi:hypothetical protein